MERRVTVVRGRRRSWLYRVTKGCMTKAVKGSWRGSVVCLEGWRWSIPLFGFLMLCAPQRLPPLNDPEDVCSIFGERPEWVTPAKASVARWGVPIHVMMAIMYQESSFVADAKPPWYRWLGVFPLYRVSSAYGYSQALDMTWQRYRKARGRWFAIRSRFDDAIDFIGWYSSLSRELNGIRYSNVRGLYLAYHEGHRGYARGSWKAKKWLQNVAKKVEGRARVYQQQLARCPSYG